MTGQVTKHFNVRSIGFGDTDPRYAPKVDEWAPLYWVKNMEIPPAWFMTGGRHDGEMPCRVEENEFLVVSLLRTGHKDVEFHETEGSHNGGVRPSSYFLRDFVMKYGGGIGRIAQGECLALKGASAEVAAKLQLFQALMKPDMRGRVYLAEKADHPTRTIQVRPQEQAGDIARRMCYESLVAQVAIDAKNLRVWPRGNKEKCPETKNAVVSKPVRRGKGVAFDYAPKSLPLPLDEEFASFNREIILIQGLDPGLYVLSFDGREVGCYTAEAFAQGVNVAALDTPNRRRADQAAAMSAELAACGCGANAQADDLFARLTAVRPAISRVTVSAACPSSGQVGVPSFTMRIDDNHEVKAWERVAEIFERRGVRVSFAVVPAGLSEEQGACLKRLSARGHVIMDHTPNHSFYQATYHDRTAFDHAKTQPFVAEINEKDMKLRFRYEADDAHPKNRRMPAYVEQNIIRFKKSKNRPGMYSFVKLPGKDAVYGLQKAGKDFELRDFWRQPLAEKIDLAESEVLVYDQAAIQPCDDVLRELAAVSRERFDHFGLPRPTVWVRPGGWDPGVSWDRLERIYGREFGYIGADSVVNAERGSSRWSTGYDAMYFFDQGADITPEQLVDQIEQNLAKGQYHVTLSHMWDRKLPGHMAEWFAKTECFANLLVARKIPTLTMPQSLEARFGK